jgi:Glycosyl transferase family 11.
MTIIPYLQGGLGNQCFIYAAARSLADLKSVTLTLDLRYLVADFIYKRSFLLSNFNIRVEHIRDDVPLWVSRIQQMGYKVISRYYGKIGGYYCEKSCPRHYQPLDFDEHRVKWVCLDGYWQSEKYFCNNKTQIMRDLIVSNEQPFVGMTISSQINRAHCPVFMHIRSYKEVTGREDGSAALSVTYFRNALEKMKNMVGIFQLFVFSDDVQWAMSRLHVPDGINTIYAEPSGKGQDFDTLRDFWLMRKCKHGIVANSSFSWWAGWLGEQDWLAKGETPIRMRVDKRCMNDDYWPDRWVAIPCE